MERPEVSPLNCPQPELTEDQQVASAVSKFSLASVAGVGPPPGHCAPAMEMPSPMPTSKPLVRILAFSLGK